MQYNIICYASQVHQLSIDNMQLLSQVPTCIVWPQQWVRQYLCKYQDKFAPFYMSTTHLRLQWQTTNANTVTVSAPLNSSNTGTIHASPSIQQFDLFATTLTFATASMLLLPGHSSVHDLSTTPVYAATPLPSLLTVMPLSCHLSGEATAVLLPPHNMAPYQP